ncbi:MAG: dipeptidase [Bacteroidota bacterium]
MKLRRLPIYLAFLTLMGVFSACQSQEDPVMRAKADSLAQATIIVDTHIDLPYRMEMGRYDVTKDSKGEFDYPKSREGGFNAAFMSIYIPAEKQETGGGKALADHLIDMVDSLAATHPDKFAVANSPQQIQEQFEEGLVSLPMGIENGAALEGNLDNIQHFYDRNVRYITLTHSKVNRICDSSYDTTRTWQGLSPFGYDVVKEMNRVGMMIDVSHVSDSTFYQVIRSSSAPVIASHSSCRHYVPGFERNMSDDMIKKLAENDGVIQINFGSTFLSEDSRKQREKNRAHLSEWLEENNLEYEDPEAQEYIDSYMEEHPVYTDVNKAVDHINHVVDLVGIDHVGFGSDFDGVGDTLPIGLKDVSDFPNLYYHLLKAGYTEQDIQKMSHGNLFRVWNKVTDVAQNMQS